MSIVSFVSQGCSDKNHFCKPTFKAHAFINYYSHLILNNQF
jgi:hypothetical protein